MNKRFVPIVADLLNRSDALFRFHAHFRWVPGGPIESYIDAYSRRRSKRSRVVVLQVGANDGTRQDPIRFFIRRDKWRGLLVEPQAEVFSKLAQVYPTGQIAVENVALDATTGERALYKISFSSSRWATGLASFNRETILSAVRSEHVQKAAFREGVSVPEEDDVAIAVERVKCVTFDGLISKYQLSKIDFLVIDTEGYDYQLLQLFNYRHVRPLNVLFEHVFLSDAEAKSIEELLCKHGYETVREGSNTLAFTRGAAKSTR